jgi:hypothetical protein
MRDMKIHEEVPLSLEREVRSLDLAAASGGW